MESSPLSLLLLVALVGSLIYAAVVGEKLRSLTGAVSGLAIATLLLGLLLGWFLDRFTPSPASIEDTLHFESLRVEAPLRFFLVTAMALLAIAIVKNDAMGRSKARPMARHARLLAPLFLFSIALVAHAKVAALIAMILARTGH